VRSYKTEVNPTEEQKRIIHHTLGVCRFVYNFYIAHNKEIYEKEKIFVSGINFSKWLNNEFIPNNPEYKWIKEVGSKAVKQSIMNGDKAFKRFFKKQSGFPKFKKKSKQDVKMYFPKNHIGDWTVERHRVKIPTLGFVRIKEKGYIPIKGKVTSGTVSCKAGKYYISVLVDDAIAIKNNNDNQGIGIDLGIKDLAVCSNDLTFKNINKTKEVRRLEKKLKREQRKLSRKYENLKTRNKNKEEGATRQNISKQVHKVQVIHRKLTDVRDNYINQSVNEIVRTKPSYITIEDLNVSGMMKNRHLSKAVAQQKFYQFRTKLQYKCLINGIELRVVDRFFPSSKACSCCGNIKSNLKQSDRIYVCKKCGFILDRDKNASINLENAKIYKIA
jgi:putative transposase